MRLGHFGGGAMAQRRSDCAKSNRCIKNVNFDIAFIIIVGLNIVGVCVCVCSITYTVQMAAVAAAGGRAGENILLFFSIGIGIVDGNWEIGALLWLLHKSRKLAHQRALAVSNAMQCVTPRARVPVCIRCSERVALINHVSARMGTYVSKSRPDWGCACEFGRSHSTHAYALLRFRFPVIAATY